MKFRLLRLFPALVALTAPAAACAVDPQFELLHEFEAGLDHPGNGVLAASGDGYFWGTNMWGGKYENGSLFRLRADGSGMEIMHVFTKEEGGSPAAGLWKDDAGYLWGTTREGGTGGAGTIYKVHAATGVLTVVHDVERGPDTNGPGHALDGVTGDRAGNLWGTSHSSPAVFKFSPATGVMTKVFDLHSAGLGEPHAPMTLDEHGTLWGVTAPSDVLPGRNGAIFKADPVTNTVSIVALLPHTGVSGVTLPPGLVSDRRGFMWGTAGPGSDASGNGAVYKVSIATGELTVVANFANQGVARGSDPGGWMVQDDHGMLWGTTAFGGAFFRRHAFPHQSRRGRHRNAARL